MEEVSREEGDRVAPIGTWESLQMPKLMAEEATREKSRERRGSISLLL